ncbi:putative PKS/NRPS-like protein biosynthetic cluster [Microsporum audouinii]
MESPWSVLSLHEPCPTASSWGEQQQPDHVFPFDQISLHNGNIRCGFDVPHGMFVRGQELRDCFSKQDALVYSSSLELCLSFMGYILDHLNDDGKNYTLDVAIVKRGLGFVQENILQHENINTVLASMNVDSDKHHSVLRTYFRACAFTKTKSSTGNSRLIADVQTGHAKLFALFNGQGFDTYFEELLETYCTYKYNVQTLVRYMAATLNRLAADDNVKETYSLGFDVEKWLDLEESRPGLSYLTSTPVSLPLIGFAQFVTYAVACINLQLSPKELRDCFSGATGHSQGIVVASFVAAVDSWDSFYAAAQQAVEVLFWIGYRCQQNNLLPMAHEEQLSSYMLSVKGISRDALQNDIDQLNRHLQPSDTLHISLVNGPQQFVIAGLPLSLQGLQRKIRMREPGPSQPVNQSRVLFSQRQSVISTCFLPIAAPFHSPYLESAQEKLRVDLDSFTLKGSDLAFPVFHTETGNNLQHCENLIPHLIQMICTKRVQWKDLLNTVLTGVTHVLDFGPGGSAGIGRLIDQQRDGMGLRTITVGAGRDPSSSLGSAAELYACGIPAKYSSIWSDEYSPRLAITRSTGRKLVDTKFSRFFGLPPVMVGGMTPTTTAPSFVAAIMNAGYHAELACGGFPEPNSMRNGILSLSAGVSPGRGITCNLIYANPRAMAWQIPLLHELRKSGIPITGLTIGAGIPSLDTVRGYIADLSLTHIGLKPGSKEGIDAILGIARDNPDCSIILQWTGGRGGGHHSYEDFHEPILNRYGQIRAHSNVILLAGSGFGDGDKTYPYLAGTWSEEFGYPPMPFDGILLGSRVMAAREARTSPAVKEAIRNAPGVPDSRWEETNHGPAGGIISVRSEMGEPIHKLATRGVMLWAELDRDVFSLPREKQKTMLLARKDYYIARLNKDFQKVWFGCNSRGEAVDLFDMTYAEVVRRTIDLLYLNQSREWIHDNFKLLAFDLIRRLEERLQIGLDNNAVLYSSAQLDQPYELLGQLFAQYPHAETDVITATDADYIILLSQRRGQKPVPYILLLDEDFEYWFKKDSLWQSERLEAVPGQDVGRICILHGPVAAQYTRQVDEPVMSILDGIHDAHIARILQKETAAGLRHLRSTLASVDDDETPPLPRGVTVNTLENGTVVRYSLPSSEAELPSPDDWMNLLARSSPVAWCNSIFTEPDVVRGRILVSNPIRRLFTAKPGRIVDVHSPLSPERCIIAIKEAKNSQNMARDSEAAVVAVASLRNGLDGGIILTLSNHTVADRAAQHLDLAFEYKPCCGSPSIIESTKDHNTQVQLFYQSIWVGVQGPPATLGTIFRSESIVLKRDTIIRFAKGICNHNPSYISPSKTSLHAPLDLAIAIAWKPMVRCLLSTPISGNMLSLLHLGNEFRLSDGVKPLSEGDCVTSECRLASYKIKRGSGKVIEIEGTIYRNGTPVVHLNSNFIMPGTYTDYDTTFEIREDKFQLHLSSVKNIELLRSRRWFFLNEGVDLIQHLHRKIEFHITSSYFFKGPEANFRLDVEGQVVVQSDAGHSTVLGSIHLVVDSHKENPVVNYLERHGTSVKDRFEIFDRPHQLIQGIEVTIPNLGDEYAQNSGDYNPIHLSELFASYSGHNARVTHGMFTSGLVRGIVESYTTQNDTSRMRSWSCVFEGKVFEGDRLSICVDHIGMCHGKMVVSVRAENAATGLKVLSGQATIEQPSTAYVFTGQGSQRPGMGLELYQYSRVAQQVWNAADEYFMTHYGFSIINIVRENPRHLTIYFGGTRGRRIRENYMSLVFDSGGENGATTSKKVFPTITRSTRSYIFRSTSGLLHETQFTQPALALMEIARFEDMRSKGIVKEESLFAGHSLGEYVALVAIGKILTIEQMAALVFYRGLTMYNAVKHDSSGATNYSMCAVNPTRVSKTFSQADLKWCVEEIARHTGGLLEIVNYNILDIQYVCAGDLKGLATLTALMDALTSGDLNISQSTQVQSFIEQYLSRVECMKYPITLQRGLATIPLAVNVPFHSRLLRSGVDSFRNFLRRHIDESTLNPELIIGKYIPNLTAKPFELSTEYIRNVFIITKSPILKDLLLNGMNSP